MNHAIAAVSCCAFSVLTASGQAIATPEFEVASVKRLSEQDRGPAFLPGPVAEMMGFTGGPGSKDPGRIDYSKVSLKMLLARAYNVKSTQISGPDWLDTERYTIAAKLPPGTDMDQLRLMLQKLLTERFQISLHRELKDMPVYRLKVAKNGPKLNPPEKLPEFKDDAEREAATRAKASDAMAAMTRGGVRRGNSRTFHLPSATTARFAEMLAGHLDRPVRDMTELEGAYSFTLSWAPDGPQTGGRAGDLHDDQSGPSLFTALQEQLGLRLEAGKESIELLVDKADKSPIGN